MCVPVKVCARCGTAKSLDEFPPVRRGEPTLQTWCRACFAEANAANYRKDDRQRLVRVAYVAKRRVETRQRLIEYLCSHPCVDCGEGDIVVLDFDHLRDKRADVTTFANGGRMWESVLAEIEKCAVRCANCHRRATASLRIQRARTSLQPARDPAPVQVTNDSLAEIRICRRCGQAKLLSEFPFRSLTAQTYRHMCAACHREYANSWYERKVGGLIRPVRRGATRGQRQRNASFVRDHLGSHPCVDCGEAEIMLLEFDHLRDKIGDISTMVRRGVAIDELHAEIAKCDVRCANCHRRATAMRVSAYRIDYQRPRGDSNARLLPS